MVLFSIRVDRQLDHFERLMEQSNSAAGGWFADMYGYYIRTWSRTCSVLFQVMYHMLLQIHSKHNLNIYKNDLEIVYICIYLYRRFTALCNERRKIHNFAVGKVLRETNRFEGPMRPACGVLNNPV
jgi:hypothetical protein